MARHTFGGCQQELDVILRKICLESPSYVCHGSDHLLSESGGQAHAGKRIMLYLFHNPFTIFSFQLDLNVAHSNLAHLGILRGASLLGGGAVELSILHTPGTGTVRSLVAPLRSTCSREAWPALVWSFCANALIRAEQRLVSEFTPSWSGTFPSR